ncbi:Uncharacterized protein Rs2_15839 [Raphanus sativus]|nr:Uncharacterized protein Rs2_15839 [Raphanus sativus]
MFRALKKEIKQILGSGNQWEVESLQKQLDIFYCSINSNMDWISTRGELMQKELKLLRHKQKTLGSIDSNKAKSIDRRFIRLEDKMYSFEDTLGHSYYPMSDDMDALSNRMDALQQEMETIQKQLDSQQTTHPPIYTTTPISVIYPQEPADEHTESIDAKEVAYRSIAKQTMTDGIQNSITSRSMEQEHTTLYTHARRS